MEKLIKVGNKKIKMTVENFLVGKSVEKWEK